MDYRPEHDCYAILGVPANAAVDDIQRAYKTKSKLVHPDKHQNSPAASAEMQRLNEARDILCDAATRRAYDEKRIAYLRTLVQGEIDRQADEFMKAPPGPPPTPPAAPESQERQPFGLFHALSQIPAKQAGERGEAGASLLWEIGGLAADLFLGTYAPRPRPRPPFVIPKVVTSRPRRTSTKAPTSAAKPRKKKPRR